MSQPLAIDLNAATKPFNRFFQNAINSCHAYTALREDYRQHLRQIQAAIGFRFVRFHGLFNEEVGICTRDAEGRIVYNFQNLDKIYDFLLDCGVKPFVELSFMPEALASAPTTAMHYKANVTPPKDYAAWNDLVRALLEHCIERYGLNSVRTWRFEVWNEPNLAYFWAASRDEYFKLYAHTARTIKSVDAQLKVGGPATARTEWVPELLAYCANENVPIDFASTHHYCAQSALDMTGKRSRNYRGQEIMRKEVEEVVEQVRVSRFPNLELHFTEWNVSPSHQDVYGKDSEFLPPFLLQTLSDVSGLVDSYALWCFTDIFEEDNIPQRPFAGKYGLVNMHGIRKPSFYAYHFLAQMYEHELPAPVRSVRVTRSHRGDIRLLTWNLAEVKQADFTGGEWEVAGVTRTETFRVAHALGDYRVRGYRVGAKRGNALRAWQALGSPQYPTRAQIAALHAAAVPECFTDEYVQAAGMLELSCTLAPSDVVFFDVEKC